MELNIFLLQEVRKKIMEALTAQNFRIPTHYKLLYPTDLETATFVLQVMQGFDSKLGDNMKDCIEKVLGTEVKIITVKDELHIDAIAMCTAPQN